jgi:hypothetical protein
MRKPLILLTFAVATFATGSLFAQPAPATTPATTPAAETVLPPEPAPIEATPAPAAEPAPVAPLREPMSPAPVTAILPAPETSAVVASKPLPASFSERPWVAFEVSGVGAVPVSPWIQHQGWDYKNAAGGGVRLEAHLLGISLGYELNSLGNKEACGTGCVSGSFGSTKIHAVDLGYRMRLPLGNRFRPFVELGLGGIMANAGDWNSQSNKTVYGGEARLGGGLEINFGNFFVSVRGVYRYFVTQNPVENKTTEQINAAFLGVTPKPSDKAEDGHLLGILVGVGVGIY